MLNFMAIYYLQNYMHLMVSVMLNSKQTGNLSVLISMLPEHVLKY
jgi:hypothetical protein